MEKLKKVLALVLTLCMVIGSMTVSAFAEEVPEAETDLQIAEQEENITTEETDIVLSDSETPAEILEEAEVEEEITVDETEEVEETVALTAAVQPTKPADGNVSGSPFVYGTAGSNSFRIPAMELCLMELL